MQEHLTARMNHIVIADLKKGVWVNMETAKYLGNQVIKVSLKDETDGFAIHLLQKEGVKQNENFNVWRDYAASARSWSRAILPE